MILELHPSLPVAIMLGSPQAALYRDISYFPILHLPTHTAISQCFPDARGAGMVQHSKDADLPCASAHVPAGKSLSRWKTAEFPCLPQPEQVGIPSLLPAISIVTG